jgi:hypothetical protein
MGIVIRHDMGVAASDSIFYLLVAPSSQVGSTKPNSTFYLSGTVLCPRLLPRTAGAPPRTYVMHKRRNIIRNSALYTVLVTSVRVL